MYEQLKQVAIENTPHLKGLLVTVSGVSISFLTELEMNIRILGGLIGIAVGLLTLYKLIKDLFFKKK